VLAGLSQQMVSKIERACVEDLPIPTVIRLTRALDIKIDLRLVAATPVTLHARDAAHARLVAALARRLERAGWQVATEVAVSGPGWHGSIDLLAFDPVTRRLLIIETKTSVEDVGELDRQLGSYERAAWDAARARGWRPAAVTGIVALLMTDENDRRLAANRTYFDGRFRVRYRVLEEIVSSAGQLPEKGERGLAMMDPRSRASRTWIPTWIDGRRSSASYRNRADFLSRQPPRR
jgi:hypothetical protein